MTDGTEHPGEPTAPDLSGPPSLRDAIRAFTTPGTDPDALMKALKDSRIPSVPLSQIGKATQASAGMRWCQRCGRPEPANMLCPDSGADFAGIELAPIAAQIGTTCASCHARGVGTMHSPAGEEHEAWEAKWAQDPGWMPERVTRWAPVLPVPVDPETQAEMKARAGPRRWQYPVGGGTELPADPFPDTDVLAGMGIAQMLDAMEAGGVPPLRAERIIGAMLAAHGMMHKEAEGEQG